MFWDEGGCKVAGECSWEAGGLGLRLHGVSRYLRSMVWSNGKENVLMAGAQSPTLDRTENFTVEA